MTKQPLSGIRVLDLTQVMAGPFCTMLLADLGADVIKVERPGTGDQTRQSWGRPAPGADSPAFYALNRNKRSMVLDLLSEEGRAAFDTLITTADVVVENFRPGVAQRLGVDYQRLSQQNPAIVYASISGFGQYGPYADRPGYDLIAQGMAGAMSVTGEPGGPPVKSGIPLGDLGAGLFCTISILAAYEHRRRTGRGQYVETSLYEAILALSVWESTEYWATGRTPKPLGSANRMTSPYQALRTSDGFITIGANNERLWTRLCVALDRPDLIDDPRYVTNADRMDHRDELAMLLENTLMTRSTQDWATTLLTAGVPCGPILNYSQILDEDPHAAAREMVQYVEHPTAGLLKILGFPMKFSETPPTIRRHPPLLGEHTEEVLEEARHRARPHRGTPDGE